MWETVTVKSREDLIDAIAELRPHDAAYVRIGCLFEVHEIKRYLTKHLDPTHWEGRFHLNLMKTVEAAVDHHMALDYLDLLLDLMRLDLEGGIPLKGDLMKEIRKASNTVVATAHTSTSLALLDGVTMEAQRVARVAVGLGCGARDVAATPVSDDTSTLKVEEAGAIGGQGPLHLVNDVEGLADQVGSLQIPSGHQEGVLAVRPCDTDQDNGAVTSRPHDPAVASGLGYVNHGDADRSAKIAGLCLKIGKIQSIINDAKNGPYGDGPYGE